MLRVDLTDSEITEEEISPEKMEKFVGGVGLGSSILREEIEDEVDAFAPENRLIFATGPFAGTKVPGSGTYSVVTKGPLTEMFGGAQANGWFGARMKFAGYDGIVFHGKASELSYVLVTDEDVQIETDPELAGKDTYETQEYLKDKLAMPKSSVACIGPAGENEVRFANIASDGGHFASTNGIGAVMGSKNLKAVVVAGDEGVPVANEERFEELAKEWQKKVNETLMGATVSQYGTNGFFSAAAETGWLPVKNLTTDIFEKHPEFNGDSLREKLDLDRTPCHACPLEHCNEVRLKEGRHEGLKTDEPEYEGMAAFGPLIGNDDYSEAIYLNDLNDRLGMDLKEIGFTLSLILECVENGILDEEDLDGLDLDWGDIDGVEELMKNIAHRKGVGDMLAEGVYRTAKNFGEESLDKAVYTHEGIAPHIHDPRGLWGYLFGQTISNMGSIEGFSPAELVPQPDLGMDEPVEKYKDPYELVEAQGEMAKKYYFVDNLGTCFFTSVDLSLMTEALEALTGMEYSKEEALKQGHRTMTSSRLFNISQGWSKEEDKASERLLEPCPDGPNEGVSIREDIDEMVDYHYRRMGWDEKGHPKKETLKELNLD